jgi:hypothetical protein
MTKFGHAKGIWQFIPLTAEHYGLRVGPLYREGTYDLKDERFHFDKATEAAAKYIRNIRSIGPGLRTSRYGFIIGARQESERPCAKCPKPAGKKFLELLKREKIPRETYDHVITFFRSDMSEPISFGFDLSRLFSKI